LYQIQSLISKKLRQSALPGNKVSKKNALPGNKVSKENSKVIGTNRKGREKWQKNRR
jgi:hypothetical protein